MDFDEPAGKLYAPQSPEKLARILEWSPFIKKWAEESFGTAEQLALRGFKIPGQKVVRKNSRRKYRTDMEPPELAAGISKVFGLEEGLLWRDPELKPMSEVQTLVEQTVVPKERLDIRKRYEADFLVKPKGDLTIAPVSDKRPEVGSVETDFKDEEL